MPDAERPYRAWISVFTGAIVASAICIALLYTKTSNERLGCCDYANWYSSLLFDKG
jgi:hypothetical protein